MLTDGASFQAELYQLLLTRDVADKAMAIQAPFWQKEPDNGTD